MPNVRDQALTVASRLNLVVHVNRVWWQDLTRPVEVRPDATSPLGGCIAHRERSNRGLLSR